MERVSEGRLGVEGYLIVPALEPFVVAIKTTTRTSTSRGVNHRGDNDMTKTELERAVADVAGVERRTASAVLDALEEVVTNNVRAGEAVTIRPGFIKVSRKDVKARKAREGTNPFTGEPTTFKARPASKTARVTALKKLKDAVATKRR
jgi:nucleoid DNA-binding protein